MEESKCKKCGKELQEEDFVFMGYCEECYNQNKDRIESKLKMR